MHESRASGVLQNSEFLRPIFRRPVCTTEHGRIRIPNGRLAYEKVTREKNDDNENVSMDDNERI